MQASPTHLPAEAPGSNPTSSRGPRKLPLLSIKIGVAVAVAVFVIDVFSKPIQNLLPDPGAPEFLEAWFKQLKIEDRLSELLDERATGSESEFTSKLDALSHELAASGSALYLVGVDGQSLYESPELLSVPRGGRLGVDVLRATIEDELVGLAVVEPVPIWNESGDLEVMCHVVRVLFDARGLPDLASRQAPTGESIVIRPGSDLAASRAQVSSQMQGLFQHASSMQSAARGGMAFVVAVLAGSCVALLVTRRIRRLARQASIPSGEEVPGPFCDSGHDEIGDLAGVLSSMRDQSRRLIQGLRETDRNRREWVTQLSHDCRTPLAALGIALDRAGTALRSGNPERLAISLESAACDAQRLNSLIADILELGRLELEDELHLEPVLARELVHSAMDSVRPIALNRGVSLTTRENRSCGELTADGSRLLRTLENLLSNALRCCESRVEIVLDSDEELFRVVIEDDGPGFDLDSASGSTDLSDLLESSRGGKGLGLRVANRIATAHGGRITVESAVPRGARLTLEVPFRASSPDSSAA